MIITKDEAMGKLFIIRLFLLCSISVLIFSCKNKENNTSKLNDYFVRHEVLVDGKSIHFLLPIWYTNKDVNNKQYLRQYVDNDVIRQSEFVYFSTKNDNSFFALYIKNDSLDSYWRQYDETTILDSVVPYMVNNYSMVHPGTTFTEKKWDKNNRSYYFLISLSRYYNSMRYNDSLKELMKSDSIQSDFIYLTFFGMKEYGFIFSSIENIKDFSYEEKRKVLESITIEDSK